MDGPGTVVNEAGINVGEPSIEERELAMGYQAGTTKVAGISKRERARLLGSAFDLNAMKWLVHSILRKKLIGYHGHMTWLVWLVRLHRMKLEAAV